MGLETILECGIINVYLGFADGSIGKESACNAETRVRSLGLEDSLEKEMPAPVFLTGKSHGPAIVHGVTKESDMTA